MSQTNGHNTRNTILLAIAAIAVFLLEYFLSVFSKIEQFLKPAFDTLGKAKDSIETPIATPLAILALLLLVFLYRLFEENQRGEEEKVRWPLSARQRELDFTTAFVWSLVIVMVAGIFGSTLYTAGAVILPANFTILSDTLETREVRSLAIAVVAFVVYTTVFIAFRRRTLGWLYTTFPARLKASRLPRAVAAVLVLLFLSLVFLPQTPAPDPAVDTSQEEVVPEDPPASRGPFSTGIIFLLAATLLRLWEEKQRSAMGEVLWIRGKTLRSIDLSTAILFGVSVFGILVYVVAKVLGFAVDCTSGFLRVLRESFHIPQDAFQASVIAPIFIIALCLGIGFLLWLILSTAQNMSASYARYIERPARWLKERL